MFRVIRCGVGYRVVIVVSPPDAGPDTPGVKCYQYASYEIFDYKPDIFNEISTFEAQLWFYGIPAQAIGFEEPPKQNFNSLDEVLQYVKQKRAEYIKELNKEAGVDPDEPEEGGE